MKIAITQSGKIENYNGSSDYGEPFILLDEKAAHDLINNISQFEFTNNICYDTFDTVAERERLIGNIAKEFGLTNPDDMFRRKRNSKYVYPRHLYIAMLLTKSSMSSTEIGRLTGYNHSTVLYTASKAKNVLLDKVYGPKYKHIMAMYGVNRFYVTNAWTKPNY